MPKQTKDSAQNSQKAQDSQAEQKRKQEADFLALSFYDKLKNQKKSVFSGLKRTIPKEQFKADKLKRVGLNLALGKVKEFKAESLRTVVGNLEVQSAVRFKADALLNVGGKLAAESAVEFEADHLQNIGDEFHVSRSCLLKISSLQSVNGKKYISDRGQIDSLEVDLTSISALAPQWNLQSIEKAMKALKERV